MADARGKIAATTYDRYLDALERDIYPGYADVPMADIKMSDVGRILEEAPKHAKENGRSLTNSGLMVVKAVMSNVINFANEMSESYQSEYIKNKEV